MSDKKVSVKIDVLGNPTIEAIGFNGVGCKEATRGLEDVFKGGNLKVEEKPEMHNVEESTTDHYHETV